MFQRLVAIHPKEISRSIVVRCIAGMPLILVGAAIVTISDSTPIVASEFLVTPAQVSGDNQKSRLHDAEGLLLVPQSQANREWLSTNANRDSIRELDLSFVHPEITDEDLQVLASYPHVERLNLEGARITDAGLRYLSKM